MCPQVFQFFKRSGKRVSRDIVAAAKADTVQMYRNGTFFGMRRDPQPAVATAIERMSLVEFCRWSGSFTYRVKKRG
jgi:hypothetical protein